MDGKTAEKVLDEIFKELAKFSVDEKIDENGIPKLLTLGARIVNIIYSEVKE